MGTAAYGGKGFKGRTGVSGERPIGAAQCRQQSIQASCQPPPPSPPDIPRHTYVLPPRWLVGARTWFSADVLQTPPVPTGRDRDVLEQLTAVGGGGGGGAEPHPPFWTQIS